MPPLVLIKPLEVRFESVEMFCDVLTEKALPVYVNPVPAVYEVAYCGIFNVFPVKVAAPVVPVVVKVNAPCLELKVFQSALLRKPLLVTPA